MNDVLIGFEFEQGSKMNKSSFMYKLKDDLGFKFNPQSNTKLWHITYDTSIQVKDGYFGHELVSPVFPLYEGIDILQNVFKWMKNNRSITNHTTGFHVNLSFKNKELNTKIDLLKLILFLDEERILRQFKRSKNSFCQGHQGVLRYYAYTGVYKTEKDLRDGLIIEKEMFVNLAKFKKKKYLEFRGMGNRNYHLRVDEIVENIFHFVDCMKISSDPLTQQNIFKQLIDQILKGD
jgi:hypothetical protein